MEPIEVVILSLLIMRIFETITILLASRAVCGVDIVRVSTGGESARDRAERCGSGSDKVPF